MQNKLEKYLSQIEKQLAALPAEQRQEELREIRSHLEMMIDDNVARGCDADDAVSKALEQFGAAEKVGKALECTHEFSPEHIKKAKKRMRTINALIYFPAIIFYGLTLLGIIPGSSELSSGVFYFTSVVTIFVGGWFSQSVSHKKIDVILVKWLPAYCLITIVLTHIINFLSFPFVVYFSCFTGATAYRLYAYYQKHSDMRQA